MKKVILKRLTNNNQAVTTQPVVHSEEKYIQITTQGRPKAIQQHSKSLVKNLLGPYISTYNHHINDKKIVEEIEKIIETKCQEINQTMQAIVNANIPLTADICDQINHSYLTTVLDSKHIPTAIQIMEQLNIEKNIWFLLRINESILWTKTTKKRETMFLHSDLLQECVEYFGLEKLQQIFTCDFLEPSERNWYSTYTKSGKTIEERMAEARKIIDFCTHIGFDSGIGRDPHFMKVGEFTAPIHTDETSNKTKTVNYLGSYAAEMRYIIEQIGIPFETLFALPKEEIGLYCGVLRSLQNCTRLRKGDRTKIVEFTTGNKASELELSDVLNINTLVYYSGEYSILKLKKFINFLKKEQIKTTALPDINFLENPTIESITKRYIYISNTLGGTQGEYNLDRNSYIKNPDKIPNYLKNQEEYNNIIIKINAYKKILHHTKNKDKFIIASWNTYFKNPDKLKILIENMKADAHDITKNMDTVLTLVKTLKLKTPGFIIGNPKTQTHNISLPKKYIKFLRELDRQYAGLYSIGGKIHTEQSIDNTKVEQFSSQFGFGRTPFQLIHANTSVLLPPSYFPEELMFMIQAMGQYGLFEHQEKPQLQISIPGRLQEEAKAAILASSMILLSKMHVEYSPESFSTTHNSQTGRMMVSYDAGEYDPSFKYNSQDIDGRTDILLLRDINLIPKAKVIGSLLSQTEYDGRFAQLGIEFIRDYMELMAKYGLENMITQKPRVFKRLIDGETIDITNHYTAVKSFTDRQAMDHFIYNQTNQSEGLLVFEVDKLLQRYRKKIQSIQSRFI